MSTVPVGQWTPGFPLLNTTLAQQMGIARNFVTHLGSIVTVGPISMYSQVQGLVARYGLSCGQPDYQTTSLYALEGAHEAFVAKFKPAMAQAFGARLGDILKAQNPGESYKEEGLLNVELPDMVGAGLLTYADAKNFSARMAELTRRRILTMVEQCRIVGHPCSLSAWVPRVFIYLTAAAFTAGLSWQGGNGPYIVGPLLAGSALAFVGEASIVFFSRVLSGMFQFGSVNAALDVHTHAVREAEDMTLYKPAQDGEKADA